MKKIIIYLMILLMPINVFAYSNYIIPGGNNIGIEVNTDGVLIVGFYKVKNKYVKSNPELKVGDKIAKVDNIEIKTIKELITNIEEKIIDNKVNLTIKRNDKEFVSEMIIEKVGNIYKTGLYVKDTITGTGTLSYIDPGTNIFGALGHEIIEGNSNKRVDISNGKIYDSNVTAIYKSIPGKPGEKTAKFNYNIILGSILTNTTKGIYGIYNIPEKQNLLKVAQPNEIKLGKAKIRTVLSNKNIDEFEIEIKKINYDKETKNIYFEITDNNLINKTGGIIQGMSGSPIIQNNMIIGAVTHVIVDKPTTGYGIFITSMLENGEKK
mgnify:CR=1 FL=1